MGWSTCTKCIMERLWIPQRRKGWHGGILPRHAVHWNFSINYNPRLLNNLKVSNGSHVPTYATMYSWNLSMCGSKFVIQIAFARLFVIVVPCCKFHKVAHAIEFFFHFFKKEDKNPSCGNEKKKNCNCFEPYNDDSLCLMEWWMVEHNNRREPPKLGILFVIIADLQTMICSSGLKKFVSCPIVWYLKCLNAA